MKRYLILLLPGAVFPYLLLFFLFGFFRGFLLDWRKFTVDISFAGNLVLCIPIGESGFFNAGIGKGMVGEIFGAGQYGAEANSDSRLCDRLFAGLHLRFNHLAVCLCDCFIFLGLPNHFAHGSDRPYRFHSVCRRKAGFQGSLCCQRYPVFCLLRRRGAGNYLLRQIQTPYFTRIGCFCLCCCGGLLFCRKRV